MRGRLLLVEDDPRDVKLFLHATSACGLEHADVTVVRDGAEALELLTDVALRLPDLVLLDVKLPKVDGLEVLAQVRATASLTRLPVVMHSSSREERDISSAYDLGANAYVVKTVDHRAYTENVQRILDFWLRANTRVPALPAVAG